MIELDETTRIDRPPSDVFARLAEPEAYGAWLPGIRSIRRMTDGPVGLGAPVAIEFASPAGPIRATGAITDYELDRAIGLSAEAPQLRFAVRFDLAPTDAGPVAASGGATDVRLHLRLELKGGLRFAEGMVARQAKTELPAALARLRARVETG